VALHNAILVVGIDPTKRDGLFRSFHSLAELLGGKDAIVTVVISHCDIVLMIKALEGHLASMVSLAEMDS
jgi:hypothetical protein